MSTELIDIHPTEIKFLFELKKQISSSLWLFNPTDKYVAFKVKLTSPKKYCVRPNSGIILPHTGVEVIVTMQAQKEAPIDMQCMDKFLIQSVMSPTTKEVCKDMFIKEVDKDLHETILKVLYVTSTQQQSLVKKSSKSFKISSLFFSKLSKKKVNKQF